MKQLLAATIVLAVVTGEALAHFPFIVPTKDGSKILVVFNDALEPDGKAPIERIASTTLFSIDATGTKTAIKWTKDEHALTVNPPGKNSLVIGGFTDRGFVQSKHTENKPVWIKHYPKAIVGDLALAAKVRLNKHVPLELVPLVADGRLRFQALWNGKPLPEVEVTVLVPDEPKSHATKTDAQGVTTDAFDLNGRYGARVGFIEKSEGDLGGKKYEEIRSYATLVLHVAPSGR
jgi:uncharacterized GH25 family protein